MDNFKNEITPKEWFVGSGVVVLILWMHFLFPRGASQESILTITSIPYGWWKHFAIYPRDIESLLGILTAPLVHAGIGHLSGNLGFLIVFMIMLAKISTRFWQILSLIWVLAGVLAWTFHPSPEESTHLIGASAVVFGLVGYIIPRLLFNRDLIESLQRHTDEGLLSMIWRNRVLILLNLYISFVCISVLLGYREVIINGMGMNSEESNVSFVSHTLGFVAGIVVYVCELIYVTIKIKKIPSTAVSADKIVENQEPSTILTT